MLRGLTGRGRTGAVKAGSPGPEGRVGMLEWVGLVLVAALGTTAAGWLRTRRYRRTDDEVERTLSPWWVPVVSVLAAYSAAACLPGLPPVVLAVYGLALVWAVELAVVDLEVKRLPDALVLPAYPAA